MTVRAFLPAFGRFGILWTNVTVLDVSNGVPSIKIVAVPIGGLGNKR